MTSTDRKQAALDLARYCMGKHMAKKEGVGLTQEELNMVFVTAGVPVLTPSDIDQPELKAITITGGKIDDTL